jgi:hypothetical protein
MTTSLKNNELKIERDTPKQNSESHNLLKKLSIKVSKSIIYDFIEPTEFIYIRHINNKHIYEIAYTSAKHSKLLSDIITDSNPNETYGKIISNPILVSMKYQNIDIISLEFIIDYMKYYDDIKETPAPEAPIKKLHISLIIGDDYKLFAHIYGITDSIEEKITKINNIIRTDIYFGITHLYKKLSAIIASLLINLDIDDIKKII